MNGPRHFNQEKISCSVVGARGYAGLETSRLLLSHPNAHLVNCFATGEFKLDTYLSNPKAREVNCLTESEIFNNLTDVYFLATPAEVSLILASKLLALGKKVIDLSGAFRLKKHDYSEWYGFSHHEKDLLSSSHYGLVPWAGAYRSHLSLIANPGCYATAITMALIPLLKDGLIENKGIVIDAKSGTTGAGKKASENLLFTEVEGDALPYKIGKHQHYPEVLEAIESYSGSNFDAHFTTSLLPVRRGIIAHIYAHLKEGVGMDEVHQSFVHSYKDHPLVVYGSVKSNSQFLSLKKVVGTAKTHLSYEVVGRKLYLFSCIDNLMKGAASQAIENFNFMFDLKTSTGLTHLENMI